MANEKITTIKLKKDTKGRLEKLRIHKRESYDEIIQSILNVFNLCRVNPEKAQARLLSIEKAIKRNAQIVEKKD